MMSIHPPTLTTPRLALRPFTQEDIEPLHVIMSAPDVMRYFPRTDSPDLERTQRMIAHQIDEWATRGYGWWAVTWAADGALLGWCGLQYLPDTDETEVGYLLGQPWWGRGLATEAARASVAYGFERFGFAEIIGITHPENLASQRVLQKCGMTFTAATNYFGMDCFRFSVSLVDWPLRSVSLP
jgi:ribosomal-protein-alanine N-acetyltransferase